LKPRKAIIVGGSVGGLFAAVLLQRAGWKIKVYERSGSGLGGKGAGLVAQPEVWEIFDEIGRGDVAQSGVAARERIFLDRQGNIVQTIRTPQTQISWDLLYEAFRSSVADGLYETSRVAVQAVSTLTGAEVHFDDGSTDAADLVIGADGVGSMIRTSVAPDTGPRYAGYAAFRGLTPESQVAAEDRNLLFDRFTFFQ
jgi:2-polyprenyl-6-methoxyphenol hydroxylase-like FAD-dependent oxidoreductase